MTEGLLEKLEEKMMVLLAEVELLRSEREHLSQENMSLKIEREKFEGRIKGLVSLFDSVELDQESAPSVQKDQSEYARPVLVEG